MAEEPSRLTFPALVSARWPCPRGTESTSRPPTCESLQRTPEPALLTAQFLERAMLSMARSLLLAPSGHCLAPFLVHSIFRFLMLSPHMERPSLAGSRG